MAHRSSYLPRMICALRTSARRGWLLLAAAGASAAAAPPNVLFLLADDMRADSIAALGNPTVKTPHLDSLARRGFAFTNAYCLGGNSAAVCLPSRNMLLSGNAYFRWQAHETDAGRKGMFAPADAPNFPMSLEDAGYATYHHGKRGNTALLIQDRFDINKYLANDEADRTSGEPGKAIADEAIEFLRSRDAARPFFMYLAFANPHDPRVAAPRYMELYDRAAIPLPRNYMPVHPFDNGEMTVRDEKLSPWPRTEDEIRRTLHEYYATISGLDSHIGRILAALDELGLTGHTIVIFSADQGIAVGSHGLLGKQSLYDHSMKCPLILAGPGIPCGRSDALVYLLDIYPTVCDLVGAPVPHGIDGISFRPVIEGASGGARPELFLAYRDVQRALRDPRWKLIRYPQVDVTQLFDLEADPDETRDLASDPAHAARVAAMLARLAAAQPRWGDTLALEVADPRPAAIRALSRQPTSDRISPIMCDQAQIAFETVLARIARAAHEHQIRLVLVGGWALNAYGVARQTLDIDFMCAEPDLEPLEALLTRCSYRRVLRTELFARFRSERPNLLDVDLIFADPQTLQGLYEHGRGVQIGDSSFRVPELMLLIATKLHALKHNAPRRLTKGLTDILALVEANAIDVRGAELRELCLKYGSLEIYEHILKEASG